MPIADNLKLIAEVTHKGNSAAGGGAVKNFANVYHFRRTAVVGLFSNTAIANAFIAAMVPNICAALNVDFTTTDITCRCVNDALDAPVSVANATAGAIAGERLPDYNAVTVIMRTAARGRNYRGRKHYGPISESDSQDDVLIAGAVTRFNTINTTLGAGMTDANGNFWIQCVLSRELSTLDVNPTNVITNDVTERLLNKSLGTMRRRKIATVR